MNEYLKYTTCFYVFDLYLCEEPINLIRNLDFTQNDDIIIISLKNIFKRELINIIKTHIEKYFSIKNYYKFLNINYTFQKNAFLILVKQTIYNDVENIYYKHIRIYTKKKYGKTYKEVIRYYFNEYLEDKLNKKEILENEQNNSNKNNYETILYKNMIQHKINNMTYNNFINKYFKIDKNNKRLSNSFLSKYEEKKKKKNENEYEKNSYCSSDPNRKGKSIIKNIRISSNYSIDKRKKIFIKEEIKEDIKRKTEYDDNLLICLTFKIKNVSFCIAFSNFTFYEYLEKLDYYKYIFYDYNKNNNKKDTVNFNYMNFYIKNYYMYCKQIYNYFINNIIFETKNEDLYLFNIDVIIFLGFDNFILFNYQKENILNNNSFFFDQNIVILNKNKKNFLQKKIYSTLTKEKGRKLTHVGYKVLCDLFMQIEVDIIDNFFYKHFHEIKQKNKNIIISLNPKVIDFNLIHTYQIYQANFEISYDYKGNSDNESFIINDNITINNSYYKYNEHMHKNNNEKNYEYRKELRNEDVEYKNEKKKKKKKNYLLNILDVSSSKRKISQKKKNEKSIHNENYIYDEKYFYHKKNNSEEFCSYNISDENNMIKFQEKYNYIFPKKSNVFYINDEIYLNDKNEINEDKIYFSILCLDTKSNSTIPVNLYSYLHLKKNSIFKYLEENIRFKKEGIKKISKSKNSLINENNFDMIRYTYIYPYKGVIKKNSKKKIQLNLYVEQILNSEILNDSFVLIIRIHNFVKDMFLTIKFSLKNNIVNSLLHSNITNVYNSNNILNNINDNLIDINNNLNLNKNKSFKSNTNISLQNLNRNSDKKKKYNIKNIINGSNSNNIKIVSFLSANFAKFIFSLFFTLDDYEKDLLNSKDEMIDDIFYFFRLTNLNNYHLLYSFNPILTNLHMNKRIDFTYFLKRSFYIKYNDKKTLCSTFFIDNKIHKNIRKKDSGLPYEINYLIEKIKDNEKIEKKITLESFLLLCEQLFYILNKNMIYCSFLDTIKNIYNYKISKNKKMCLIFYTILKNCSLFYKNIFLVFISFLKKLFTYFIKLSIHNFHVLVLKKTNDVHMNLLKKKKKHYFRLFLDAFNFFHISFLSYVSTFFFSFLDIQIALDLIHYLLFYL
ncbi:conserved Plasmodium protein, unknown function [Plasmodium gallinaceum]|uniref:Uncharacterized protein n=1 Tax=Plasmodium gallinaceum TaxID=5849 RepID=A0A1J1GUH8_PLAGA|nr:conserved Plasmodium protein, unknown function [Plasmodium gallinaceum]CRG94968.1 conserved Plasmodium protein, unknown function [Plasmodium gallinaceum]